MALTGYYKTYVRPRLHKPLSMLKYDPVGTCTYDPPLRIGAGIEEHVAQLIFGLGLVRKKVLFLEQKRGGK